MAQSMKIKAFIEEANMKETQVVTPKSASKDREWGRFLLLAVVILPILAACAIGAYGLFIWVMQMLFWGPPS